MTKGQNKIAKIKTEHIQINANAKYKKNTVDEYKFIHRNPVKPSRATALKCPGNNLQLSSIVPFSCAWVNHLVSYTSTVHSV